jgi:hypothetical protein
MEPTVEPSASEAANPEPREGWTAIRVAEDNPYAHITDVYDDGRVLIAIGQADRAQLGVWLSEDALQWAPAEVPPPLTDALSGRVADVVRTDQGLVAVAVLGLPEGSEPLATGLYSSADGNVWRAVGDLPDGVLLSALAVADERIFAGGSSGIWVSDDAGRTWRQAAGNDSLGGQVYDLHTVEERIWAGGFGGTVTTQQPVVWSSDDRGLTWERVPLGGEGTVTHFANAPDGNVHALGAVGESAVAWAVEGSSREVSELGFCCIRDAAGTPTGLVAAVVPYSGGGTYVASSRDGITWSTETPDVPELTGLSWSDRHGLLATSDLGDVILGPVPYP